MADAVVRYDERRARRQQFRNSINRILRYFDALQDGIRFIRRDRFLAQLWRIPSIERRLLRDRHDVPPNRRALVLKFHCAKNVRSHRLRWISDLDRDIKEGREALSHEQLAQLATHKNRDWHHLLSPASRGGRVCGFGVLARVGYRRRMRCRACNTVTTCERLSAELRRSGRNRLASAQRVAGWLSR